jgi:hypothetical protein
MTGGGTGHSVARNDRWAFWKSHGGEAILLFTGYRSSDAKGDRFSCRIPQKGYKTPIERNAHNIYTMIFRNLQAHFVHFL